MARDDGAVYDWEPVPSRLVRGLETELRTLLAVAHSRAHENVSLSTTCIDGLSDVESHVDKLAASVNVAFNRGDDILVKLEELLSSAKKQHDEVKAMKSLLQQHAKAHGGPVALSGAELTKCLDEFYINGIAILAIASLGILGNVLSLMLFTFRSSIYPPK